MKWKLHFLSVSCFRRDSEGDFLVDVILILKDFCKSKLQSIFKKTVTIFQRLDNNLLGLEDEWL